MKNWRPKDWDALDIYASVESIEAGRTDYIEAGADAMLEALLSPETTSGFPLPYILPNDTKGQIVFIPDEGEK